MQKSNSVVGVKLRVLLYSGHEFQLGVSGLVKKKSIQ